MNCFVVFAIAAVLADFPFLQPAAAETWPDQPIHIVVPFTPGSATDVVARIVAAEMAKGLGQPVIVDNRPGAGGTIGAGQVARAEPGGYTLLANSSAHTVNPAIFPDMTFDTRVDLRAITMLAQQPNILVAAPSKGFKTAVDFANAAKAEPGKITYATAGTGSGTHMNAEKFRLSAGIGAVHVPYRGTPEALRDTMNGVTDICFCPIVAALPMIKARPRRGAGQRQPHALLGAARARDNRGAGLRRQRLHFLGRLVRACGHAAHGDRPAERRGEEGARSRPRSRSACRRSAPTRRPPRRRSSSGE